MGDVEFDGLKKYDEDCDEHCPVEFPQYYGGNKQVNVFDKRQAEDKEEQGMRSYTLIKS